MLRGQDLRSETIAQPGAVRAARGPAPPLPERLRQPSLVRSDPNRRATNSGSREAWHATGRAERDEWTPRDAYDYALKRAAGFVEDEERVAIAIFYSLCVDPGSSYAALEESDKERMRWCARAALAALSVKCESSR
jgi:hypothetical protein